MTNPFNPRPLKETEFLNQELGDSLSFIRTFRIFGGPQDFNQGKAQQRYNDVCREEQVLQVQMIDVQRDAKNLEIFLFPLGVSEFFLP